MASRMVYLSDTPPSAHVELFADQPDVVNTKKAAELLNVSFSTVWRLIKQGSLKATHIGRCVRITKRALIEYLERGE